MIDQSIVVFSQLGTIEWCALFFVVVATIIGINRQRLEITQKDERGTSVKNYLIILLYLIAASSFIGLIVQPKFLVQQKIEVGLMTSGEQTIENKLLYKAQEMPVYFLSDHSSPKITKRNSDITKEKPLIVEAKLVTPQQVLIRHPQLDVLKIFGDGLTYDDWQGFGNLEIDYYAPTLVDGLVNVKWDRQLNLGEVLTVAGRIQTAQKSIVTLQLIDPAGDIVAEKTLLGEEYFSISAQPKLVGRHQYQLNVLSVDKQLLNSEVISLSVTQQSNAKILVIQSAPSFETKQLQNWAAQAGASFMQITKVNPQTIITRKTNIVEDIKSDVSSQLFEHFDLLLIDGRGLLDLTSIQQQALIESVNNGLGILLLVDEALLQHYITGKALPTILTDFVTLVRSASKDQSPRWRNFEQNSNALTDLMVPTFGATIQIKPSILYRTSTLVSSESGVPMVVAKRALLGQIGISTINQSYRWVTSGNKVTYSHYWQNLIAHLGRSYQASMFVPMADGQKYFSKMRSEFCVLASVKLDRAFISPENELLNKQVLLFQRSELVKDQYCASFWANNPGWHFLQLDRLASSEELSRWIYVEPNTAWLAEQQQAKISATLAKQSAFMETNRIIDKHYREISRWLYWWLLLLSMCSIWLLRKIN